MAIRLKPTAKVPTKTVSAKPKPKIKSIGKAKVLNATSKKAKPGKKRVGGDGVSGQSGKSKNQRKTKNKD